VPAKTDRRARMPRTLRGAAAALTVAALLAAGATAARAASPNATGFVSVTTLYTTANAPSVQPGQWVGAGYTFQMTGARLAQVVNVNQAQVFLQVACQDTDVNTGTIAGTLRLNLSSGPYPTVLGSSDRYPFTTSPTLYADGFDPATYQGNAQAPDLCGGGTMWINAATFRGNVSSTDATDALLMRFHVETASGLINCSSVTQNPAPGVTGCGAQWSQQTAGTSNTAAPLQSPGADPNAPGYIMINGSMEGNLQIQPGDWIGGGYQFDITGSHPAATYQFSGATLTLNISCNSNGSNPFPYMFALSGGPYNTTANSSDKYPFSPGDNNGSNQGDPAKWQGTQQAPDLCSGGTMFVNAQSGAATFEANVQSTDTTDAIQIQFHYIDSGGINCADPQQNPSPGSAQCGASWSGTPTVTPGPILEANVPEGAPMLLAALGVLGGVGWVASKRRRAAIPSRTT